MQTQEFLVLGSQILSDLRDNIYCLTDKLMQTAGEHDPSGYFLIEVCSPTHSGDFYLFRFLVNLLINILFLQLSSLAGHVLQ